MSVWMQAGEVGRRMVFWLCVLALSGCTFFRANPLDRNCGAIVLVFDTRTMADLNGIRQTLSAYGARATVFVSGPIQRRTEAMVKDLCAEGHEVGLSGLKGVDPQAYSLMYGQQKYFQDEIVTQVLGAERYGLDFRYFLLSSLSRAKSATLSLPAFLVTKGFARVVHKMPIQFPPRAKPASALTEPLVHVYAMTTDTFDRAQIADLARRNEILVVAPSRQVLPDLLREAHVQGVPFATLADLPCEK